MRFQATGGYYTPQYNSIKEYTDAGYACDFSTAAFFTTPRPGRHGIGCVEVNVPENFQAQLAEYAVVAVSPLAEKKLSLCGINVRLVGGNKPSTNNDWREIISLQADACLQHEKEELLANRDIVRYWPV
jgi:hypothetical protein